MIETQILGSAVGIQRQAVIDKTESTPLPSLTNGVIIGRFKRGRLDKPFTVTSENYQALLGRDPKNASYLAVEDAFKRGVSEVKIMRVGSTGGGIGGGGTIASKFSYIDIVAQNTPSLFGSREDDGNIAACLKMQIDNNIPDISSFVVSRFALNKRQATAEQAAINFLFQKIASGIGGNPWGYMESLKSQNMIEYAGLLAINNDEGSNLEIKVVLVALDESQIRSTLTQYTSNVSSLELSETPFDKLQALVNSDLSYSYTNIEIINKPSILTISRCTQTEIDSLFEGGHSRHIDMFDSVKPLLSVQSIDLNNKGFSPAIYDAERDVIEFKTGYALNVTFRDGVINS